MSVSDLQTWCLHPETDKKIHVIFDVCHMVKLLRNLLVDKKVICHEQNGKLEEIRWWYIESLNRLQEDLGFSFANKLKNQHIKWTRHKMNVSLAVQTLSSSVAAAIDFLRKEWQMENFAGSEATTDFIRKVDLAFDLLNSRNPLAKGTWSISIPKHVRTFFWPYNWRGIWPCYFITETGCLEIPEHAAKNICQKVQWNDSTQKHAIYKASVDKINPV